MAQRIVVVELGQRSLGVCSQENQEAVVVELVGPQLDDNEPS